MLAPVFLAPGKPPEGTCRMFLPFHTDPVRSLPGLGLPCNTWARVRGIAVSPTSRLTSIRHCSGYHKSAMNIITATRKIIHSIKTEIPELCILGNPPVSVVAFGAKEGTGVNILQVGDTMGKKGWHLNALQKPPAVHVAVTVRTRPYPRFLSLSLF